MLQHDIEVILARQLASYLSTPAFLVGPDGSLLFYNEAAEAILGKRFAETGALTAEEWSTAWTPTDPDGLTVPPERLPLNIALQERRPASLELWIVGHDGVRRHIDVHAFPLIGMADRRVGAIALFWETRP